MMGAEDLTAMFVKALLADFRKFNMPWLLATPPHICLHLKALQSSDWNYSETSSDVALGKSYPPHTKWRLF